MREGIPFKSRHELQWQLVLVNPSLLKQAQRRLRASGPSHTIERALEIAVTGQALRPAALPVMTGPTH
jgi:DNA-binding transcriptional regulator YdaS (Cro superfamily)